MIKPKDVRDALAKFAEDAEEFQVKSAEVEAVLDFLEPELPYFISDQCRAEVVARARIGQRDKAARIVMAVKRAGRDDDAIETQENRLPRS